MPIGRSSEILLGCRLAPELDEKVGSNVVGTKVGRTVGIEVGSSVGDWVGESVASTGESVGSGVAPSAVGTSVDIDGDMLGVSVTDVGIRVLVSLLGCKRIGEAEGGTVGSSVGSTIGEPTIGNPVGVGLTGVAGSGATGSRSTGVAGATEGAGVGKRVKSKFSMAASAGLGLSSPLRETYATVPIKRAIARSTMQPHPTIMVPSRTPHTLLPSSCVVGCAGDAILP